MQVARTLMITTIPREISDPGLITKHLQYNMFIFSIPLFCSVRSCLYASLLSCPLHVHVHAQAQYKLSDSYLPLCSPVRPTPAALSPTSASASTSTSWWGWTLRGRVAALHGHNTVQLMTSVKLLSSAFCRRKAMKGRLYFASKAQKEGKIMIKTHPCALIFCCDICGFEKVHLISGVVICTWFSLWSL